MDPLDVYSNRARDRGLAVEKLSAELNWLGRARVLVFLLGLLIAGLAFGLDWFSPWWLAAPAVVFVGLLVRYDHVLRRLLRAKRAFTFYHRGLQRVGNSWQGRGQQGERYLDEQHLYALDLDLFGKGSVFERLCLARTRSGEDTLARWLREPATPEVVRARQEAVRELQPRLDLREELYLLGGELPAVDFNSVIHWGKERAILFEPRRRMFVIGLALCNVITLLVLPSLGFGLGPFAASLLASMATAAWMGERVQKVLAPVEGVGRQLFLLARLLQRLENEPVSAPRLCELEALLRVEGHTPSWEMGRLAALVDWLNAYKNQLFIPIGLLLIWRTQMAFVIERWRLRCGPAIGRWLAVIGEMEALDSLASYAWENPTDPFPELVTGPPTLAGEQLGHPLLPRARCVCNDVALKEPVRLLVISGSNMSGKSTLLRTVGVNAVLALAGAPVRAKSLRLTPLTLGATLRVQDSLLEGRSRFYAEITRIRDILERAHGPIPLLFLLDELFHGTNSHDRGIGAEGVLRRLLDAGAIGLITTHDLALTQLTDRLAPRAINVHFADQFIEGEMHFDYVMRPGVVPHSNALALMRAVGLEV